MDISSALLDPELGCVSFTVERIRYTLSRGEITPHPSNISASGCIHPGPPEMVQLLPEEDKAREFIAIYTSTMLSKGENYGSTSFTAPDRIHYRDQTWRVVRVKKYHAFNYCQALAVLIDEGSGSS